MKKYAVLLLINVVLSSIIWAQTFQLDIRGKVLDANNEALPGVTILVKNSSVGTVSDINGNFTLVIPDTKAVVQFSYIGYTTLEFNVSKSQTLNVVLHEDTKQLDEVMVIGYGQMKKRDITGAINSISSESIEDRIPTNVYEAMQGQTAGLQIVTGSGAPGEGAEVRIRGVSTFESGAAPLYVVDGVPFDAIDDINPTDIESIEILKDAASAAIYGSRSANGVILITTKQGEKTRPRLDINYLRSYSSLSHNMPKANAAERKYYDNVRYRLSGGLYGYSIIDSLRTFMNQDMDLQDLLFRTAIRDQVDLSASGASDAFKYYVSAAYLNENGIIVNSDYNRLTSRINMEYKPNKNLTIGNKIHLAVTHKNGIDEDGVLNQLLVRPPYWAIFNSDGSYVPNISSRRNPYAVAMTDVSKNQSYRASLYEYAEYRFLPQLKLNISIQGNYLNNRIQTYRSSEQISTTERTTGRDYSDITYDWSNENYLSYNQTFNDLHEVNAMLGASFQYWGIETVRLVGYDYTSDEIYTLNAASLYDTSKTYTTLASHSLASFFGRFGYSYKGKYLFNSNLRYDGSSRFGSNNKWGLFPSASFGWRFSDEKFMRWSKRILSDGKLRASWGMTGNQEIGNYDSYQLYSPSYIYENISGISASSLAYNSLSWEQTSQYNIGLDLSMLRNRLRITADFYHKNTDGLLCKVELPKEIGFQTIRKNVGAMYNEGYELSIDYDILRKKNFKWSVNFNIATNNSVITKLADGIPFYKGMDDAIYVQEGCRLGEFYGYRYLGVFAYNESNAFTANQERLTPVFANGIFQNRYYLNGEEYFGDVYQKKAADGTILQGGDADLYDSNGDGKIDLDDKRKIGCAQADIYGGLSTNFSYKGLSLFLSFYYSFGGQIYNYAEAVQNSYSYDGRTPTPDCIANMWTQPGDDAVYPRPVNFEHNRLAPTDFYLEDASYVKLRNLKISYTFPDKWMKKVYVKKLTLSVYGNNLLTFTNYSGYDPEFSLGTSDPLTMGIDQNRYPRKREFGFGLNVRF